MCGDGGARTFADLCVGRYQAIFLHVFTLFLLSFAFFKIFFFFFFYFLFIPSLFYILERLMCWMVSSQKICPHHNPCICELNLFREKFFIEVSKLKILRYGSSEWAVNPMTRVLIRERQSLGTEEEQAVWPWGQRLSWCCHSQGTPAATRRQARQARQRRILPKDSRGHGPEDTLIWGFWPPELCKESVSDVLVLPVCGNLSLGLGNESRDPPKICFWMSSPFFRECQQPLP